MNASLRRRLSLWLSGSILLAGVLAAAFSFALSYQEANELQDTQLEQLAAVVSRDAVLTLADQPPPRDHEEAETRLVVRLLGNSPVQADPELDVAMPASLPAGLQSLQRAGVRWRAIVGRNTSGQRFGIAQRMTVRDEVARDTALLTLLPLLMLVPVLLLIVGFVLRRTFAPLAAISAQVDRVDGSQLAPVDERKVPREALPLVQAVNRLLRRLGTTIEMQRRLVSDAAHELRTPVATLIVQADNVMHVPLPPQASVRMDTLRVGLTRMSALLDQLLDFARIQGRAAPTSVALDLEAVAHRAIEETLPMAQAKGVDLGCIRLDHVTLVGDPVHAYALLRNAVDNAVKYTPAGGSVDVSICVDRGPEGAHVSVVIDDTGPGIATADRERVFEPFVRVLGHVESGSGLGLSIARTAAIALGGRIELGDRPDGLAGLRFIYRQALD